MPPEIDMADQQEELEAAALQLPETGRARLARILLLSLGESAEDETERIWAEEADRRYQEIQRGDVAVQDSNAVFKEARARLR
ncbi:MAG: addiction module protein [Thermoanaerobaculia bacterium]